MPKTRGLFLFFLLLPCLPSISVAGEPLLTIPGAHGLAFSADDKLLAIAHKKGVDIWDVKAKKRVAFLACNETLFSVAFSPDGSSLAGGGLVADVDSKPPTAVGHIYLWDLKSGKQLASAECANETAIGVAFLAGGDRIVAGGEHLALYDARKLHRIADFSGWMGPFLVVNQGKQIVAVHRREAQICLADVADGKSLRSVVAITEVGQADEGRAGQEEKPPKKNAGPGKFGYNWLCTRYLAATPDNKQLAMPANDGLKVYDMTTGKLLNSVVSPRKEAATCIVFSSDGRTIAFANFFSNRITVWSISERKAIGTFSCSYPNILDLCFSHDGKMLASLSMYPVGGDDPINAYGSSIELWKIDGQRER